MATTPYTTMKDFLDSFRSLLESHAQLNTVHFGLISDVANPKNKAKINYPYAFGIVNSGQVSRRQIFLPIDVIFMTQVQDNEEDIINAQSDMLEIARDVMGIYLIQGSDAPSWSLVADTSFSYVPFVERFSDMVAGVTVSFQFEIDTPISKCDFPTR